MTYTEFFATVILHSITTYCCTEILCCCLSIWVLSLTDQANTYVSQIMPKYTTLLYPTLFLFYGVWHFLIQMRFYHQL